MKNKYKLFNLLLITIALVGFGPVEASLYQDAEIQTAIHHKRNQMVNLKKKQKECLVKKRI